MSRAEVDLQISVKKACNTDEVPPKRKHVRACIVYTWDHKNSRAFWNAVKIQPLQSDQVQSFKALIMIHKVLQEGHPNTLKDGYRNRDFISSLATIFPSQGTAYGRLINQYDKFILKKLDFHRNNPGFNGTFEYEEYISLRAVHDPNEGYDSILQLMDLQDLIDDFQKLIFATIHQTPNNLCKVSALVPLIAESYGIYKFCISMLRALYQQLGSDEALAGLVERFESQHFMLRDFFTDCHGIKFLTSLVTIPRLANNPPNVQASDGGSAPISRPRSVNTNEALSAQQTSSFEPPANPPPAVDQLFNDQSNLLQQQQQEQERIQRDLELQQQQQLQNQLQQQRLFEDQQRQQERRFLEEQEALKLQSHQQQQSRVSELEHDLLMFKNQYDNDQLLLQQYDSRVKSLETELMSFNDTATQQIASKDEQIKNLEDQIQNWIKKYEALAKLYSQLRQEHLNLLAKFKKIQQKINSAQESILKKEKFEKDLKSKNVELADLIRERDRARLDVDRVRASKDQEIEKLQAEIRELNAHVNESGKLQNLNLSTIISKHEKDMEELRNQLKSRDAQLGELGGATLQDKLKETEIDLEIAQESLDSALRELAISKEDQDDVINAQIDHILLQNVEKMRRLIDIFLENNIKRVQDSKRDLDSSIQAGNLNATPEFVLSIVELCSDTATEFATTFNSFIAEGRRTYDDEDTTYSDLILSSSELTTSINELMLNSKGLTRVTARDEEEKIINLVSEILHSTEQYFFDLKSDKLNTLEDDDDKIDRVIDGNLQLQNTLQTLVKFVDGLRSSSGINFKLGNLEDLLRNEMEEAAKAVSSASSFLSNLLRDPSIHGGDVVVHEALLEAAKAITDAVALLITAATESQREIVSKGRGDQSRTEFYKKNNRWTEGLISASKAVAGATNVLIQTADGVLKKTNSHEQLIVASNEVAASTAQLVAASRVKANFVSKTQDNLEQASTRVSSACKLLVTRVQKLLEKEDQTNDIDLSKLTPYEGKTVEMEQQVEILKLENKLNAARKRLGEIRKHGYRDDNGDDES
ncbi:structural constituent of cytoskeleton [Suhomyces tanzawaensis NRRL Y-17324]|uniref:Structural constituent of cytoskeleton n=1 Tax=Suhomyces tanzawaensis NRRL Y-17324 TaxID=984487 RepID=A0A1E4SE34_9ASCO|nr:structural constituent of cytoskeleton [Suhomyces tanzawaensis NRRL Y-17324]ODV77784.1 structural constituent of cytoskeleton [Suhomyces tanzawaensis NRRL Y-17324]